MSQRPSITEKDAIETAVSDRITVRLSPDVRAALAKYCQLHQVKISEIAQRALHELFMAEDPEYAEYIRQSARKTGVTTARKAGSELYHLDQSPSPRLNEDSTNSPEEG